MNNLKTRLVPQYRWFVFIVALGYWLYLFTTTSFDAFGWQFRFLTVWGLTFNLLVAGLMLRIVLGYNKKTWDSLVSATAVLNMVVVFLYWKLYFEDPTNIYPDGPLSWHLEYYLHAIGPMLMWFDAFFIFRAFRKLFPTLWIMLAIFFSYIAWIELLVSRFNTSPAGTSTNGLPYPFLNDMTESARSVFYAGTLITALVLFVASLVIMKAWRRAGRSHRDAKLAPKYK